MNSKKAINICILLLFVFLIPTFVLLILQFWICISLACNNQIETPNAISMLTQSLSIFPTLIISFIALIQSKKINDLEEAEYDFNILVKNVDESIALGNDFLVPKDISNSQFMKDLKFSLSKSFKNSLITNFTFINLTNEDKKEEKCIKLLPLKLVTINKLIITDITFESIKTTVVYSQNSKIAKEVIGENSTLLGVYDNNSTIPLVIGVYLPKDMNDTYTFNLELSIRLKDQNTNSYQYILICSIFCDKQGVYLISSSSKHI